MGVWIETIKEEDKFVEPVSHPTWVCGLKQCERKTELSSQVTPYVGVWIETKNPREALDRGLVTPYVGVWIETPSPMAVMC